MGDLVLLFGFVVFFRQKTAYERRMSDWSSDVCSSDLGGSRLANGRSEAIGGSDLAVPEGATVIDAAGKWVTPGIIDIHSHLGNYPSPGVAAHSDGNEMSGPLNAGVWAEHSVWPQDPGFSRALAKDRKSTRLNSSH